MKKNETEENKTGESNLEETLRELEQIVQELEIGKLDIEESLRKFEKGVRLYKDCKKVLGKLEKKIKVLTESIKEEDSEHSS